MKINFVCNYLPDLRITEIVLSGAPAADFDAIINHLSWQFKTHNKLNTEGKTGRAIFLKIFLLSSKSGPC